MPPMTKAQRKTARAIVEASLERGRKGHKETFEGMKFENEDPFSDTHILDEKTHVLVTYDGSGYDWLSYEGEIMFMSPKGSSHRNEIEEGCKKAGLLMEDHNNWSFGIYPN